MRVVSDSRRSWVALGAWARYAFLTGRPWRTFGHVLAEHMESPGTKAYTNAELRTLFRAFSNVSLERFVTPYDARVAGPLARVLAPRGGWFVGVRATR